MMAQSPLDPLLNLLFGNAGITVLLIALLYLISSIKILWEYERGVVFLLGRFYRVKGPGLILVFPFIQHMMRVELRVMVLDIPTQDVISRDNVSLKVNAVLYYRVVDPQKAIIHVENYHEATSQLAQTTLRSVLGRNELDVILAERDKLNADLQHIIDEQTENWGIKVMNVEIKRVDLDESMIRAIAKQAEAERERRAKVIHAEGELQASEKLLGAAHVLAQEPQSITLRYLQTLGMIAEEKNSTIVFPIPIEIFSYLRDVMDRKRD
jgi:regulator of protease activity HflC (stomatin/prohibitin superfamily)